MRLKIFSPHIQMQMATIPTPCSCLATIPTPCPSKLMFGRSPNSPHDFAGVRIFRSLSANLRTRAPHIFFDSREIRICRKEAQGYRSIKHEHGHCSLFEIHLRRQEFTCTPSVSTVHVEMYTSMDTSVPGPLKLHTLAATSRCCTLSRTILGWTCENQIRHCLECDRVSVGQNTILAQSLSGAE